MTETRRVSVVIPTYLRPQALEDCVRSLGEGSVKPNEIIIVGRESDHATRLAVQSICRSGICSCSFQSAWVNVPGHIPPVEAGLHLASEELVAFVDDDVTVTHNWLALILRHFADPSVGVVGGSVLVPTMTPPKLKGKPGHVTWYGKTWGNVGWMNGSHLREVDTVMEGNWVWRRDLLRSLVLDPVLNFDDASMYGLDLCLQAKELGYRVLYDPQALVYHHAKPRAPELDRAQRPARTFSYCRNYTYIMLKHLPAWRKPIFLAWWFGIGERVAVGLAAWVANLVSRANRQKGESMRGLAGKIEGVRLWLRGTANSTARPARPLVHIGTRGPNRPAMPLAPLSRALAGQRMVFKQPMRILIYAHYFPPSVGGVERVSESLARGFAERGHRVTVVTATPAAASGDAGLSYRVVRRPGLIFLASLIRQQDVIHLAGPALLPLFLARLLRRPAVIEHHLYQAICPNGLLLYQPAQSVCPGHFQAGRHRECLCCNAALGKVGSFRMWVLGFPRLWLCKGAASNVAVSNHVLRRLSLPRSQLIYHGVPSMGISSNLGTSLNQEDSTACFGYVGRFVAEKGLPVLVEAAALLQRQGLPFRLKFIGDGPERPALEDALKRNGLEERTVFTGMLDKENLHRETAEITAIVMPSIWEETAGLAAMEQMMRGRASIVASIGGLAEVVGDAALTFSPGDSEGLAACMRRLIEDRGLARKIGAAARARAVAMFRESAMIDAHLELYQDVCVGSSQVAASQSFRRESPA